MTRGELADQLHRLDPGASLTVEENVLAGIFGVPTLPHALQSHVKAIADFALEHGCTFSFHENVGNAPRFEKEDIF